MPERIRHTPLVAMKYNRQNRTENPLEVGGGGGDEAAWGELGGGGGDLGVGEGEGGGARGRNGGPRLQVLRPYRCQNASF